MKKNSKQTFRVLFDETQFRGSHPGEQTYAILLLSQLAEMEAVEVELLEGPSPNEPLCSRSVKLVSNLPTRSYGKLSDLELIAERPKLWQKVANGLARKALEKADELLEEHRLEALLEPAPDIVHLSRFRLLKFPDERPYKVVATVHDVIPSVYPEFFSPDIPAATRRLMEFYRANCDHVIAVSERTRQDLLVLFGFDPEFVSVVHNGFMPNYWPEPDSEYISSKLTSEGAAFSRYFLWVSTIEPRKNFAGVYDAYRRLQKESDKTCGLVVVGSPGWMCQRELEMLQVLVDEGNALWLQGVSEEELRLWYSSAIGLLMPSFYEGFGLPVVEALACGCPVITSRNSAMSEITGETALLVDPHDEKSIFSAMKTLLEDEAVARDLSTWGPSAARSFTPEICASKTLDIYRKLIEE